MYLNKAFLIGNLTRDPEMRAIPNGTKVVQLALATNRTWKDQNGMKKESVEYHNVVAFGKPAEIIAQYAKKGSSLYVEGRMQTRSWDGTDGAKKYRTELVLENFQFGPKTSGMGASTTAPRQDDQSQGNAPDLDTIEYPDDDINPEDIPF